MPGKMELYSKVLGLKGEFTHESLRKKYRDRAKELHPDRNTHPRSHEYFVLLQEAYQYFEKALTESEEEKNRPFDERRYPESYRKEKWKTDERIKARQRAAARKKMREEHYRSKGYYRILEKMFFAMDILRFIAALFVVFCFPPLMYFNDDLRGLLISFFVQIVTFPLWIRAIRRFISFQKIYP